MIARIGPDATIAVLGAALEAGAPGAIAAIATAGLVAPEFQLIGETAVAGYTNYMQSVVQSGAGIGTPRVDCDWQSMSNRWPARPITTANWSIIPQGVPAKSCSAF